MKYAIGVALTTLMFAFGGGVSTASAQAKWDYSTEYAPTAISGRISAKFAERVKELTDNQLTITIHYSGGLGFKSQDNYTAVEDGALPIADTPFNRMNGIFPIFDLQSLPFLQSTFDEAEVLDRMLRPIYNNVMGKNNQFVLYTVPWTPQGIWSNRQINTIEDLRGLRIRVNDLAAVQTMKEVGADAIQMSWGDTLTGLSTGSINAVLTSDDTGLSGKLPEAGLKHFAAIGFTVGLQVTHVNRDAFNDLSEELQTAVLIAAAEAEAEGWRLARSTVEKNLKEMENQGVSILTDLPDEFGERLKQAAEPAIADWKRRFGTHGENLIAAYQSMIANAE